MPSKVYCKVCTKLCRKNQDYLQCISCKCFMHRKCLKLSKNDYACYTNQRENNYTCEYCMSKHTHDEVNNTQLINIEAMTDRLPPCTKIRSSCPPALNTPSPDQDSDKPYVSVSDIDSKLDSLQENNLFALHLNIVSLVKNIDQVKSLITQMNTRPHIICLTETRLKDEKIDWQSEVIQIKGYSFPQLNYDNSFTDAGGVAIYIQDSLIHSIKHKPELRLEVPECESVFFELSMPQSSLQKANKILIGCIYRHHRHTTAFTTVFTESYARCWSHTQTRIFP